MIFAYIHEKKASFPVTAMCRLFGVTPQGYYAFVKRPPSARAVREAEIRERIQAIHKASKGRYGSPRILQELQREQMRTSKRFVERAMRDMGLRGRGKRRFRITTAANPRHAVEPNILDREFTATRPNERWVTDISYIWTAEGWMYLAAILDLYSRSVVGWALDTTLSTKLPLTALQMAIGRRKPSRGLLHHSDRGCQYTSAEYRRELARRGATVSMSRKGNCWDNAVAESFFATLKTELVYEQEWATRSELRAAVFEYIEIFYNRQRLHSSLGYKTPAEVEAEYALANAA